MTKKIGQICIGLGIFYFLMAAFIMPNQGAGENAERFGKFVPSPAFLFLGLILLLLRKKRPAQKVEDDETL